MLKISDILKKAKGLPKTAATLSAEKPAAAPKARTVHVSHKREADVRRPKKENAPIAKPAAPLPRAAVLPAAGTEEKMRAAYRNAVGYVQQAVTGMPEHPEKTVAALNLSVSAFIDALTVDEVPLLRLFFSGYYLEQGYMSQHPVNVCLLALHLGAGLRYSRDQLMQVGIAALLHDIGLSQVESIISQPRVLQDEERVRVRNHPRFGKDMLSALSAYVPAAVFDVVEQEHERCNGTGYPAGLEQEHISEFARLIGLIDTYEALTHIRPYRDKYSGFDAVKEMVRSKEQFDRRMLKMLIDTIGLYPVATFVKLNTREIGSVVRQNRHMPLRPMIAVTHNAQGQTLTEEKVINLAETNSVYIQDTYHEPEPAE